MSILSLASGQSAYHGYDYFQNKKVLRVEPWGDTSYHGTVVGSNGANYDVTVHRSGVADGTFSGYVW